MSADEALSALYQALEAEPADPATLLDLAGWYERQGSPDVAGCLRWAAECRRRPFRYRRGDGAVAVSSRHWHDGWYWWAVGGQEYGEDWGHPAECRLPPPLWHL